MRTKPAFNAFKPSQKGGVRRGFGGGMPTGGPKRFGGMPSGGVRGGFGGGMPSGMAGGWVWMPAGGVSVPLRGRGMMSSPVVAKGKAKGKGKGTGAVKSDKHKEKLRSFDVSKKAWVGGLSKNTTWKQLEKHFKDADLKPALIDVNERKGTAVVCFNDEDDVNNAVASLNGSELDGQNLEVDVWEKLEKKPLEEGEEKPKRRRRRGQNQDGEEKPKQKFAIKNMQKEKKPMSKIAEKLKSVDADLKVWVGGLADGTTFKELSKHFEETFAKPDLIEILPKNRAVVTYKETGDVASAIAIVNGSEFKGKTLEVDVWTKPEKREKVKKEKED